MATILFDIVHPAHLNFFKNTILSLEAAGHRVVISFVDRGIIKRVLDKEFPNQEKFLIGVYRKGTLPKIAMVAQRLWGFQKLFQQISPTVTAGVGNFPVAIASRLRAKPSVLFYDDYEFPLNFRLSRLFGSELNIPDSIPANGFKIKRYKSFKELAYLHPQVYRPHLEVIHRAGLQENGYVFAREVSNISMNYTHLEEDGLVSPIRELHQKGVKVLLSLEDKSRRHLYEPYCEILQEPLEDIYSLIAYSKFMLTSGDSMAREAAVLGVPAVYTGGREMCVNTPFIEWGGIVSVTTADEIESAVDNLLAPQAKAIWQEKIKGLLESSLENPNKVIEAAIVNYL